MLQSGVRRFRLFKIEVFQRDQRERGCARHATRRVVLALVREAKTRGDEDLETFLRLGHRLDDRAVAREALRA